MRADLLRSSFFVLSISSFGCGHAPSGAGGATGSGGGATTASGTPTSGTNATNGSGTTGASAPTSSATTGKTTAGAGPTTTSGSGTPGGLFSAPEPWTKDVSALPPAASSDAIIQQLVAYGGFGAGGHLSIDFSIPLFFADASTPVGNIDAAGGAYMPDSDPFPFAMPLPANGNAEGSATNDYVCDVTANDCHVLVVRRDIGKLFEAYNMSQQPSGGYTALLGAAWDLTKTYPDNGRGDGCSSADAAGFPIAALMPTPDEVKAGAVQHAIRFILPNSRMKAGVYVHPASHAGGPSSPDTNAPPYGVRFRLRSTYSDAAFNAGEKVIIQAMKTYGMLLSDGGNIALTFPDDRTLSTKWADVGIMSGSFAAISAADFEVVDLGPEYTMIHDCVRNP